ncbi:lactonase family protein [Cytobacillus massiliigabonensis]|uniref:lactonase family protein n=1 Tax=Cytobacillus massiliigabonensis TaxID=1871011 RepID=UPI000C84CD08|nr:lactonase family protein [Cytobacillus massiliigabonensis]
MESTKLIGYIGTYTKSESEGIYVFSLNTETGKITDIKLAAKLDNPTYLAISSDNQFVYSVVKEGEAGGVASFKILDGDLKMLNKQMADGAPPCHVSIDLKTSAIFSANYHKGTVESFLVDNKDGSILPPSSVIKHQSQGGDKIPHTHYAAPTPDEKYIITVDLGLDQMIIYDINEGILKEKNSVSVKPGSGPRHLVFHPNGNYVYIMTEFSSEVIVFTYESNTATLTHVQTISTIPGDFQENNQGSAIHISSDGRYIYAGNRGHNSIAVFGVIPESGELEFIEHASTEGNWPRDFALDPTENFIVASNQNSHNLVLFSRDKITGKLTLLQSDISVPEPVCVKFLNIINK